MADRKCNLKSFCSSIGVMRHEQLRGTPKRHIRPRTGGKNEYQTALPKLKLCESKIKELNLAREVLEKDGPKESVRCREKNCRLSFCTNLARSV